MIYSVYDGYYDPTYHALTYGVIHLVYEGIYFFQKYTKVYTEYIPVYTFPEKYMMSYDGIGILRYMLVYGRHMSVYDKTSALILAMATDGLGMKPLISGTCLLILPSFVPGCFRDW